MAYNPGYVDGVKVANNAAYVPGVGLHKVYDNLEGGVCYWIYITSDSLAAVQASGYISDATFKRLKLGDIVDVFSGTLIGETNTPAQGVALGAVTFAGTVGVSSLFSAQPQYMRMIVSAVTAGTTTVSGVATLTQVEPISASFSIFPRNAIDGGDFTVNPWQRGTSFSAIASTATYTADRWVVKGGASSSISVSKQTQTDVPTFNSSLRFGRGAGTDTAIINLAQIVETLDTYRLQGQVCTLSFWAKAGAQFSALNSALNVLVATGTGADQGNAGLFGASWTGYSSLTITPGQGTATAAPNIAQPITTTATRYSFTFTVPANATELGIIFSYAPTGTNNATDTVDFYGVQLETGGAASAFEHRDYEMELALCQRYYTQFNEVNGAAFAIGVPTGTNTQSYSLWLPTPMRVAPTVTVTVGGFNVNIDAAGTSAATGLSNGAAHSPTIVTLITTVTLSAAAHSILLVGTSTTGAIKVTADL